MRKQAKIKSERRAVIRPLLALAFGLACVSFVTPAAACMPYENEASQSIRSKDCSVSHRAKGEYGGELLSEPVDLGGGFVLQTYVNGSFCGASYMPLLTDCSTGETLAVGYASSSFDDQGDADPVADFQQAATQRIAKGGPNVLQDMQKLAAKSFEETSIVSMRNGLRLSIGSQKPKHSYNLRCGCKRFYPESSVATD